ncbi:MAG: hypothetical protein ACYTXC_04335 [Nostoc sp.]
MYRILGTSTIAFWCFEMGRRLGKLAQAIAHWVLWVNAIAGL